MTQPSLAPSSAASSPYRHAAYFAPKSDSLAWDLGSRWLGRCAFSGKALTQPPIDSIDAGTFHRLTQSPRLYGWHATLKAPFELGLGASLEKLQAAFTQASTIDGGPFHLELQLADVDDFLALVPRQPSAPLNALAERCVRELHSCALPLSESELTRRRAGGLTSQQENLLQQWGYPFVMEAFQFHLTLTGSLRGVDAATRSALLAAANDWFAPLLDHGVAIDAVTWFAQDVQGGDFRWVERFDLRPSPCA